MAIRFDVGELKRPHRTDDGMLICEATFARDGVLEYRQADGKIRREFRPPDENKKALTGFGIAPVTIEHPPVLLTEDNAEQYRKGISLQNVQYGKGGFVRGEIALLDSAAIEYATKQDGAEISAGYLCDIEDSPGEWQGQRYDCVQRNLRINHLALTRRGRAGPDVRLHLDSEDADIAVQVVDVPKVPTTAVSPPNPKRMATLHIDSANYEVPEVVASVVGPKLSRLDALESKVEEQSETIESLKSQLSEATDDAERQRGRADMLDIVTTNAEIILEELGYKRDSSGDFIKMDGGKKKMHFSEGDPDMDDESDAAVDEEEMAEEEMMKGAKKKKMKKDMCGDKKMDSADVRMDAKALVAAWKEADSLVPQLSEQHFDAAETPEDVRRLVVKSLRPKLAEKLDSMTDETVSTVYELIKEEAVETRTDAKPRYSNELNSVISGARAGLARNPNQPAEESAISTNYQQPLSLSR